MKTMKGIMVVLVVLFSMMFSFGNVFADSVTKNITFHWNDSNQKTATFFWSLYVRNEGEQYDYMNSIVTIPYVDGQTIFQSTNPFTVEGTVGGEKVKKYFVLRANDGSGNQSGDSNEVEVLFFIPLKAPFSLTIDVNITN